MEGFLYLAAILAAYVAPTFIAGCRGHHNSGSICVINVFLGWTLIGWVIALAWSLTEVHQTPKLANINIT
jgi:hypothetical protein